MSVKRILSAIMVALLFVPSTLAYDVKTLQKEKKELIKQIKKEQSAKKVTPVVSEDGSYYYFLVEGKNKKLGVVDQNGKLIVPMEYTKITYLPPVEEGVSKVECRDGNVIVPGKFLELYHKKTDASFFAAAFNCGDFYNLTGTKVSATKYNSIMILPGFVILKTDKNCESKLMHGRAALNMANSRTYINIGLRNGTMSFYHCDGTPIAEDIVFIETITSDMIEYKKNIDNVEKYGLFNIRKPQESVPCIFSWIYVDSRGVIKVKPNLSDEYVLYTSELGIRGITYRDDGEKFFNQKNWDEVIKFYQSEGIDAPWAGYIAAEALYRKAKSLSSWIISSIHAYDKNPSETLGVLINSSKYDPRNLEVSNECYVTANKLNNIYLAGSDSSYIKQARSLQEELNKQLAEFASNKKKFAQIRKQSKAQINMQNEQRQQVAFSILSAISNALSQAASKQNNTYRSSSVSNSVQRSSNNTATVKQGSVSKPDNNGRKAFLRSEIATWKNKLKKAQDSYNQAMGSGEDTWQKKRVMESKQKTIDTCLEMIHQYETELNSLK